MRRAPLAAVVVLLAAALLPAAGAAPKANERVLVVLASIGSKPYTVAEVRTAFQQADAFIQRSSFGQVHVQAEVTPWLTGLTVRPSCGASDGTIDSIFAPASKNSWCRGYM